MGQWSGEGWSWDIKLWLAAQREAVACLHGGAHSLLGLCPPCLQGGAKSASEGPGPHPQVGLLWCTTHTH